MKRMLLENLDKLHTTKLGEERIRKNMSLECDDVIKWCKEIIERRDTRVLKKGKNLYIYADEYIITVNASSYTVITVHHQFY